MKRDPLVALIMLVCILSMVATSTVCAAEAGTVKPIHWDISDIIILSTTVLAAVLGIISFIGYRRDGRTKVLLVTGAFLLFAMRGVFILSGDPFTLRQPLFDIVANLLDFGVLACFFLGMTMK
jgi:hypothetical protein